MKLSSHLLDQPEVADLCGRMKKFRSKSNGLVGAASIRGTLLLAILVIFGAAIWTSTAKPSESAKAVLKIGSEIDYPPFAIGKPDGSPDGFTVDLWKAVAKEMNLDFNIRVASFHDILQDFKEGRLDMMINLAYSDERAEFADLSVPHVNSYGAIFVRKGDHRIQLEKDLADKSVIVIKADLADDYATSRRLARHLVPVRDAAEAMKALSAGQHDAVIISKLVGLQTLRELGINNITTVGPPLTEFVQKFCFAVRKGNTDLLAKANEGLAIVKANGTYETLYEKWFGVLEPKGLTWRQALRYAGLPLLFLTIFLVAFVRQSQLMRQLERKSETLRQSEAMLAQAQHLARLGNWSLDLATRKLEWSKETFRIFGRDPATYVPSYPEVLEHILEQDRPGVETLIQKALSNGRCFDTEFRITRLSGQIRWLHSKGQALANSTGQISLIYGTVMDVTEIKQAEAERQLIERQLQETQKLESLGVLAGGIAHDFNNLLTTILGNAGLARVRFSSGGEDIRPFLEAIEHSSQRASDLCKQMLAYSGQGRFVVEHLDIHRLIEEMGQLLRLSVSKKATLKLDLARDLPAILADATQIRQVLMNLIINGSEAIGDKGGTVTLKTCLIHATRIDLTETYLSPDLPEGDYILLEVNDTGCGMDPEVQKRIFEPFFTTKFTGRGLGLSAVLGIMRGHKGALKVRSEKGVGTTFTLLFPRAEGPVKIAPPPAKTNLSWRGHGTALVVDDEESVRSVMASFLNAFGFEVLIAGNGREAVERFREHAGRITFVLLDLTMPQLDGLEAFREIQRIQPKTHVVLMSGYDERVATGQFAGQGLAGFIQKPFTSDELREKLLTVWSSRNN